MPVRRQPAPRRPPGRSRADPAGSARARGGPAPRARPPAARRRTARAGPPPRWAAPRPVRRRRRPAPRSPGPRRRRRRAPPASRSARRCRSAGSASRNRRTGGRGPRSVASSAASVSLSTRIARARGWRRIRATASAPAPGAPSTSPACGPPSSLSPDAVTSAAPWRERGGGVGLVGQQGVRGEQARPDVGDDGHAEIGQLVDPAGAGEPAHHEVRRVHLEHERGVLADGRRVVGAGDPVRRADLAQPGPGRLQQRGDAEAVADLHQLAAGDDHLPALRQRQRDERERRGAVVRDVRGRSGGHGSQQRADRARAARAALAGGQVQLHVARARRDRKRRAGRVRQRRPPEVRVQQHAGGVEDRAQRGGGGGQRIERGVDDLRRGQRALPHGLLRRNDRGLDPHAPQPGRGVGQPGIGQHHVGARDTPPRIHPSILRP